MEEKKDSEKNNLPSVNKLPNMESPIKSLKIIENPLNNLSSSFTISKQLSETIKKLPIIDDIYPKLKITNTLSSIIEEQKKLFLNPSFINSITNPLINQSSPLMDTMKRIAEMQRNMINTIMEKINISPFFEGLSKTIEEARKNPHSFLSWYNYYERLSDYFWVYPYDMKPEQLHQILETVTSEKEFDKYMSHYFSKKKIKELLSIIKNKISKKHKRMIGQIEKAYDMKLYALANNNLMSIIDDLLSFYLYNKGCTYRSGIFEPIVKEFKKERGDIDDSVLVILMVNSYINKLYDSIDFNIIKIDTHKKSRRGMSAHGKFTSNERSDFIMLINTIYHLLLVQEILKKYRGRIFRKGKVFYIPKGKEYIAMKEEVDKEIEKKKKQLVKQSDVSSIDID